jgi:hypothetical protein
MPQKAENFQKGVSQGLKISLLPGIYFTRRGFKPGGARKPVNRNKAYSCCTRLPGEGGIVRTISIMLFEPLLSAIGVACE